LDEAIKHARYIPISAWGEPLISPNLPIVLDKIFSLNNRLGLIAIVTNGTRLSPELAKSGKHLGDIAISLNAGTADTYNRDMEGGDFQMTLDAIRSFMEAYPDLYKVSIHMVAHAQNYQEIPQVIRIASSLGIPRVRVDQLLVHRKEDEPLSLLHIKQEYNHSIDIAKKMAADLHMRFIAKKFGGSRKIQKCLSPFLESYVWADGKVAPCCWNGILFMGNAYETSFEQVWSGDEYQSLRKHPPSQCVNCPKILPLDNPMAHVSPWYRDNLLEKDST